jgi:hypothetical protein
MKWGNTCRDVLCLTIVFITEQKHRECEERRRPSIRLLSVSTRSELLTIKDIQNHLKLNNISDP